MLLYSNVPDIVYENNVTLSEIDCFVQIQIVFVLTISSYEFKRINGINVYRPTTFTSGVFPSFKFQS